MSTVNHILDGANAIAEQYRDQIATLTAERDRQTERINELADEAGKWQRLYASMEAERDAARADAADNRKAWLKSNIESERTIGKLTIALEHERTERANTVAMCDQLKAEAERLADANMLFAQYTTLRVETEQLAAERDAVAKQVEAFKKAATQVASWMDHASTCNGWGGLDSDGDPCFRESDCSCGLGMCRDLVWPADLRESNRQEVWKHTTYIQRLADKAERDTLRADLDRLVEALRFYANPDNWGKEELGNGATVYPMRDDDTGDVARSALAALSRETGQTEDESDERCEHGFGRGPKCPFCDTEKGCDAK